MLAERPWFWVLVGLLIAAAAAGEPRWRRAAAALRARALRRRLVAAGPGPAVEPDPAMPWSEPSLPGMLVGLWVCGSPWIWGYDQADGAIAADAVTGAAIAAVSLAGIVFPAVLTLNVLAGLWLTTAPWLVGFGSQRGPVGLSDVVAGIVTCGLALGSISAAAARVRAAPPGPVGRVRHRR